MEFLMQFKKSVSYVLSGIVLIGLSGCAHYRAKPLRTLTTTPKAGEQFIALDYEVFNAGDCKRYLDRNTIVKGYQPIQVTFTNNTERHISISTKSFSFDCIHEQEVATTVHTNTVARAVSYSAAAVVCLPLIVPAIAFGSAAVIDGVGSAEANEQLDADFAQKALRSQTVKPRTTVNGLIFISVDDDFDDFTLTVTDQDNHRFTLSSVAPKLRI
jgi:hypothetical protein